jgi:RecA/RadA recombinase
MSALDSSSTLAEIQASYDDNASYLEDASASKAKAFITAVRMLVRRTAQKVEDGAAEVSITQDLKQYREELGDARRWLIANSAVEDGGAGVKHMSFEDFR